MIANEKLFSPHREFISLSRELMAPFKEMKSAGFLGGAILKDCEQLITFV